MKAFQWVNPASVNEAIQALRPSSARVDPDELPQAFGGGQDLLTTMKDHITRPPRVVNLKSIPGLNRIEMDSGGNLKIGALVTLAQLEENAEVRSKFPGLAEAAHSVAVPQIRNLGTVGGNLCQRPRCWYFRLEQVICLKKGGNECYAESGENKYHSIFGGGPSFIVHPSDLAPMLTALGASAVVVGPKGSRTVLLDKFFILPQDDVRRENVLEPAEIITEIQVPASKVATRSTYLKFKERSSLDFALSAVAAALAMETGNRIQEARVVLGGVAPIPWRLPKVEAFLAGRNLDRTTLYEAGRLSVQGATPLARNGYKVPLTQALVRRALAKAGGLPEVPT